jgi:DNA-binding beta-propeller fold protein YncE
MKTKLIEAKLKSALGLTGRLLSRIACLGAVILTCATASAQNLFVSGSEPTKNCFDGCGAIFKFTWDGGKSIFATGLTNPWDVAFDSAGNLYVVDYDRSGLLGNAAIYKITPNGARTRFASGLSYPCYLAVDRTGNVFAADYNHGIIYEYKPTGSRGTFATGLHHPVGLAFNSLGNLFVVDNSAGMYQGHIYEYKPNGSRATFAVLEASDRPADLAFNSLGNLLMADSGGNIYRYDPPGVLRRHPRTTFGSVPGSAQSLACDNAGNLLVVDAGGSSGAGVVPNAVYKFTQLGARSTFALAQSLDETFVCLAVQPMSPVCCDQAYLLQPDPTPRPQPTPFPRPTL